MPISEAAKSGNEMNRNPKFLHTMREKDSHFDLAEELVLRVWGASAMGRDMAGASQPEDP